VLTWPEFTLADSRKLVLSRRSGGDGTFTGQERRKRLWLAGRRGRLAVGLCMGWAVREVWLEGVSIRGIPVVLPMGIKRAGKRSMHLALPE